jgi:hypothetical protein
METPYGGFSVPPECVLLMEDGDDVDVETIAHDVTVDLCAECTEIARRMVTDHETSPLPECDADAARWQDAGVFSAQAGGEDIGQDDLTERMLEDALMAVKAHLNGDTGRVPDSKVIGAYTVVLSLQELGVVETDLIGGDNE